MLFVSRNQTRVWGILVVLALAPLGTAETYVVALAGTDTNTAHPHGKPAMTGATRRPSQGSSGTLIPPSSKIRFRAHATPNFSNREHAR